MAIDLAVDHNVESVLESCYSTKTWRFSQIADQHSSWGLGWSAKFSHLVVSIYLGACQLHIMVQIFRTTGVTEPLLLPD